MKTNFDSPHWTPDEVALLKRFYADPGKLNVEDLASVLGRSKGAIEQQARRLVLFKAPRSHCSKGHEFTQDNIYWSKDGSRQCVACRKHYDRLKYERHKLAVAFRAEAVKYRKDQHP